MNLFTQLFKAKSSDHSIHDLNTILSQEFSVIIISGSCCNPLSIPVDEKLKQQANIVFNEMGLETEIVSLQLTSAQRVLQSIAKEHDHIKNNIMSIFQAKGLKGFPILLVNKHIVCYGGVPELDILRKSIHTTLNHN